MTLDEFIIWLKNNADSFQKFYSEERRKDPEAFPYKMNFQEWFEQFIVFEEEPEN